MLIIKVPHKADCVPPRVDETDAIALCEKATGQANAPHPSVIIPGAIVSSKKVTRVGGNA